MKNIKNYLLTILFSLLGGLTSITGYKYFNEEKNSSNYQGNENLKFANYIYDTTDVVVPKGLNFIYTSKKTTPAVVHIRTTFEGRAYGNTNPFDDMFRDFFGERYNQREREVPQRRGSGSGVIMTKDGYIITNNHVVENATEIEVLLNDNRTFIASIEGSIPLTFHP